MARARRLCVGAGVDEGAWGKGYALDRAAEALREDVQAATLDLGGQVLILGRASVSVADPRDRRSRGRRTRHRRGLRLDLGQLRARPRGRAAGGSATCSIRAPGGRPPISARRPRRAVGSDGRRALDSVLRPGTRRRGWRSRKSCAARASRTRPSFLSSRPGASASRRRPVSPIKFWRNDIVFAASRRCLFVLPSVAGSLWTGSGGTRGRAGLTPEQRIEKLEKLLAQTRAELEALKATPSADTAKLSEIERQIVSSRRRSRS